MRIDDAHLTDIGTYLVVAENIVGKDQTSCATFVLNTTNVDQRPLINPEAFRMLDRVPDYQGPIEKVEDASRAKPPKFVIHLPDQVKLFDGEKIHLKCKVEGYPFPQLFWTKDDKMLMASTRFTTEYEPNTGEIDVFIIFVKFVDTGVYKCRAENIYGYDETFMSMIVLDIPSVDDRPQTQNPNAFANLDLPNLPTGMVPSASQDDALNLQPPVVIVPLTDTRIVEERPTFLSCKIIGNPRPKVEQTPQSLRLKLLLFFCCFVIFCCFC